MYLIFEDKTCAVSQKDNPSQFISVVHSQNPMRHRSNDFELKTLFLHFVN